jgi:tyrosine-protein phosphatase YwqE
MTRVNDYGEVKPISEMELIIRAQNDIQSWECIPHVVSSDTHSPDQQMFHLHDLFRFNRRQISSMHLCRLQTREDIK